MLEMKFVPTVDPAYDKEVSRGGIIIVLSHDSDEICLLTFSNGIWFITGYPSSSSAEGKQIPDPEFYYSGIGYIYDSEGHAIFLDNTPLEVWDQVYDTLAARRRKRKGLPIR